MDKKTADRLKEMLQSIYTEEKDNRAQKFLIEVFNRDETKEQDLSELENLLVTSDLLAAIDADSSVYNLCIDFLEKKADISWYAFLLSVCDGCSDTVQIPEYSHEIEKCFMADVPFEKVTELYKNTGSAEEFISKIELILPIDDKAVNLNDIIEDISDIKKFVNIAVNEKFQEKDREISELRNEIKSLSDASANLSSVESQRDEYMRLYKKANLSVKKLEGKLQTLSYRLSISDVRSIKDRVKDLEKENSSYKKRCFELKEKCKELEEDISTSRINENVSEDSEDTAALRIELDDLYLENERLKSNLDSVKADNEALKAQNAEYMNISANAYSDQPRVINDGVPAFSDMNRDRAFSFFNRGNNNNNGTTSVLTFEPDAGEKQYSIHQDDRQASDKKKGVFSKLVAKFQRNLFTSKNRNDQVAYLARVISKSDSDSDYERTTLIKKCFDIQPPDKLDSLYDMINSDASVDDFTKYIKMYSNEAVA